MRKFEFTTVHRDVLADILVNNLSIGKIYECHFGALEMLLQNKNQVAETISIALQKGGIECPKMAGNIAHAIAKTDYIPLVQYQSDK